MASFPINWDFAHPLFKIIGGIKPVKSLHSILCTRNSKKHLKTGFILRPKAHMPEVRGCKHGHQTSWGYYTPLVQGKGIFTMTQFQNRNAQEKAGAWLVRYFPSSHSKQYSHSACHKLVQHRSQTASSTWQRAQIFFSFLFFPSPSLPNHKQNPNKHTASAVLRFLQKDMIYFYLKAD